MLPLPVPPLPIIITPLLKPTDLSQSTPNDILQPTPLSDKLIVELTVAMICSPGIQRDDGAGHGLEFRLERLEVQLTTVSTLAPSTSALLALFSLAGVATVMAVRGAAMLSRVWFVLGFGFVGRRVCFALELVVGLCKGDSMTLLLASLLVRSVPVSFLLEPPASMSIPIPVSIPLSLLVLLPLLTPSSIIITPVQHPKHEATQTSKVLEVDLANAAGTNTSTGAVAGAVTRLAHGTLGS